MSSLEIKPGLGLSTLHFGATMQEAEKLFGKAEEVEMLDELDDCHAIVWHYWTSGFTLFFDKNDNDFFNCVEIDCPDCLLWGKQIFSMNEKEIIELFRSHGISQVEKELHEWGETRLSFDDANIDFYFEKNKLSSVNYGHSSNTIISLILPN